MFNTNITRKTRKKVKQWHKRFRIEAIPCIEIWADNALQLFLGQRVLAIWIIRWAA